MPCDVRHRLISPNSGHAPLVKILPFGGFFALQLALNIVRGVASGLHGRGTHARHRLAAIERRRDHISDGLDLGMAGNCKVRIDLDPARAIDFTTEHSSERRRFVPSRPDHRTSLDDLLVDVHFAFRQACNRTVQKHLDVKLTGVAEARFRRARAQKEEVRGGQPPPE